MRQIVVLLATTLWIIGSASVFVTDVQAPSFTNLRVGSVEFEPEVTGLKLEPSAYGCSDPASVGSGEVCSRRYAFAPNASLRTWVSVRNDGPLAVTLVGANTWIDQYTESTLLAEPVRVTDAGSPTPEPRRDGAVSAFGPIVLEPGAERLVGVEFQTTSDVEKACLGWSVGSGLVYESIPIEWHWLANTHTLDVAFSQPIEFMAPTDADCYD